MLCSLTLDGFTFVNLIIRADASAEIGTGHVMRMMALAQAWVDREQMTEVRGQSMEGAVERKPSSVHFISAILPEALEQRLIDEGFQVMRIAAEPGSEEDLYQTLGLAQPYSQSDQFTNQPITESTNHPHWVVLDGYAFDLNYQRVIRAAGFKLLVVDDYNHLPEYECDILLNQNIGAEDYDYRINADARKLLGTNYALLRREFRGGRQCSRATEDEPPALREDAAQDKLCTHASRKRYAGQANHETRTTKHILVTMGGADTHNVTQKVIEALNQSGIDGLEVKIVVGAANQHLAILKQAIQQTNSPISNQLIIQSTNMPALMEWADLAITAAGSTCWELMALGVPMMTLVLAENQTRIASALEEQGFAINLGWWIDWNNSKFLAALKVVESKHEQRLRMHVKGFKWVDGRGAIRACKALFMLNIRLRPAMQEDVKSLWLWANDTLTRRVSFRTAPIPWEQHVAWFNQTMQDAGTRVYMAELDQPIGVVRFEAKSDGYSAISVTIAPESRGWGFGGQIIRMGVDRYFEETGIESVIAYIKPDNQASIRVFEGVGFKAKGETTVLSQPAKVYVAHKTMNDHL